MSFSQVLYDDTTRWLIPRAASYSYTYYNSYLSYNTITNVGGLIFHSDAGEVVGDFISCRLSLVWLSHSLPPRSPLPSPLR